MRYLVTVLGILILSVIPQIYAACIVNEDWPDAPCLDTIDNGRYNQDDVQRWYEYYKYKGTPFMEQKRTEMNNAIEKGVLEGWIAESDQNRNIYSYYYFSGRAPDIGLYSAQFDEFSINEGSTIHDPYTDDERYQLASDKVPLGGLGIDPEFTGIIIAAGIAIGAGLTLGLLAFWRKR